MHVSLVAQGQMEYVQEIGSEACYKLMWIGTLAITSSAVVVGISTNTTTARNVTLAEKLDARGSCLEEGYSDPYGTWINVVVQALL